jgi:hypothetical protein
MQGDMSLVADGGFFLTSTFKSHIIALNGNHLASCKTQKYTASSMLMYILVYAYLNTTFHSHYGWYRKSQDTPLIANTWLYTELMILVMIDIYSFLYILKMSIICQITDTPCWEKVFHLMDSLQADNACRISMISCQLSMISWIQVTLECEFHTKQADPSFISVGWLSYAVSHQKSAGVQSIVGITGGRHCFHG